MDFSISYCIVIVSVVNSKIFMKFFNFGTFELSKITMIFDVPKIYNFRGLRYISVWRSI